MDREIFISTVNMICKLASTNLIKAVSATGYIEDFYTHKQYQKLDSVVHEICQEFATEVFGESDILKTQ